MPRVDVTLDEELYGKLKAVAVKRGLSLSSLVRSMIIDVLAGEETYSRLQDVARERGIDWVTLMRRMLRERLDEIEDEKSPPQA